MNINSHARHILNLVAATFDPTAVIAGGFVRDEFLGRIPKDIDIYLHVADGDVERVNREFYAALQKSGVNMDEVTAHSYGSGALSTEGDFSERLHGVVKYCIGTTSIDLLLFKEPVREITAGNVLNSFDVGLCQIALFNDGRVVTTEAFHADFADNTLTVTRNSLHAERMVEKFSERTTIRLVPAPSEVPF